MPSDERGEYSWRMGKGLPSDYPRPSEDMVCKWPRLSSAGFLLIIGEGDVSQGHGMPHIKTAPHEGCMSTLQAPKSILPLVDSLEEVKSPRCVDNKLKVRLRPATPGGCITISLGGA